LKKLEEFCKERWLWKEGLIIAICAALFYVYFQRPIGISSGYATLSYLLSESSVDFNRAKIFAIVNIGIIFGAMIAAWSERCLGKWKLFGKKIRWKQLSLALAGGLLMGYGAKIANTCLVGTMLSGIPNGSFQGWFFLLFLVPGVPVGVYLIKLVNGFTLNSANRKNAGQGGSQT
jgi:uncharacterized membrane protein YedE/YeeE